MDIDAIYFDMDGVLVDFKRGQREILGIEPVDQENKKPGDDDRLFALMREHEHFYLDLKPIEGSLELFFKVKDRYGDKCRILTGVPKEKRGIVNASSDKRLWVERHIGKDSVVYTVLRKEKANYVLGRGSVLIDDFGVNIGEWRERGGTGILFTSPDNLEKELVGLGLL